jgi:hypothetical protein
MKKEVNYIFDQRLILSQRDPLLKNSLFSKASPDDKQEPILFNHKSSLEVLLKMLKNFQIDYLSLRVKKLGTKQMLLSLKDNLNSMLNGKIKKLKKLKNETEVKKKKAQKMLYPSSKEAKKNIVTSNWIEKDQLQLLNFQIENEISKTDYFIEKKSQIIKNFKSEVFYFEENREIFYYTNYENYKYISLFLGNIIKQVKKEFLCKVQEKTKNEKEIIQLSEQINSLKITMEDMHLEGPKKYIDTDEIIQEDSKEYTRSNNQSKNNSFNIHNIKLLKRLSNASHRNSLNKYKKTLFYNKEISKDILNDINASNNINNYLNMNINVNINLNNNNIFDQSLSSFKSSLYSEEENDENIVKSKLYEIDINGKNKLSISPIVIHENENVNNDKELDAPNNDKFILDIKEKGKVIKI